MKLTRKAHMRILYIWHFWINAVTKECFIVHTELLTTCLLHVIFPVRTEKQINDFTKFACYSSLLTDTCPNKLLPMDYLKCKAIICT